MMQTTLSVWPSFSLYKYMVDISEMLLYHPVLDIETLERDPSNTATKADIGNVIVHMLSTIP